MMSSRDMILDLMRAQGRADALDLRGRALTMDGTGIIAEESKVPPFDPGKDYTGWPVGGPVVDEGQVWILIQPHNAAHHSGRPSTLRALWGLCHTKDQAKAKPWVAPMGTSGMYMKDECYADEQGAVYRCRQNDTAHDAQAWPDGWEEVKP